MCSAGVCPPLGMACSMYRAAGFPPTRDHRIWLSPVLSCNTAVTTPFFDGQTAYGVLTVTRVQPNVKHRYLSQSNWLEMGG